ncbi:MAG TPA: hypothetical protein VE620_11645 [Myxococcales bacterium]|nr:hypothetical protein [Myxococcales bacterium]
MLVMCAAQQPDSIRPMDRIPRKPIDVVELGEGGLATSATSRVDKRAALLVAFEYFALDRVRNVAARRTVGSLGGSLSRLATRREALFLHLFDEQIECALQDQGWIAVGQAVTQQILRLAKLVAKRTARGELDLERCLAERGDHRSVLRRSRRVRWCRPLNRDWTSGGRRCGQRERLLRFERHFRSLGKFPDDRWNRRLWRTSNPAQLSTRFWVDTRSSEELKASTIILEVIMTRCNTSLL